MARVVIPENKSQAASAIKTKHLALGAASPLSGMDWTNLGPAIDEAAGFDKTAKQLEKDTEKAYGERDKRMPMVNQAVRSARDILSALNSDNLKALGDWTFVVDDSPQPAKPKKTA
jgi:hypothetical protein